MDASIPCPECGRVTQLPEIHLGRRFKCPGCGAIVSSKKPEASEPYAPPRTKIGPAASIRGEGEKGAGWQFVVRVKRDPEKRLKGAYKVEVAPRGLVLRVPKKETEVARVPVGTPSRHEAGPAFAVDLDGREVVLVVSQWDLFGHRLAEDIVGFLGRSKGRPVAEDYTIPRPLLITAYAPLIIAFVGLSGGAIGGGIAGGIGGGLLSANLAIVRKESWSVAARTWACLGVTFGGIAVFGALIIAIVLALRGANGPPVEPPRFNPAENQPQPQLQPQPAPPTFPMPPTFPQEPPPARFVPPSPTTAAPPATSTVSEPKSPPPATGMEGLIGYWPLEEGAGSNATDASGQGHEGALTKARWIEGIRGGAVEFDGEGFLDYGNSPEFNFAAGASFTIAGWFRSTDWTGPLVSHRLAKDGAPVIDIVLENRTVTATVREDGNETPIVARLTGKPIQDDRWHHFALVRHGGESVELYLDGQPQKPAYGPGIGGPITTDLRTAGSERYWVKTGWAAPHYLKGAIDELCVFGRDLKPEEIQALAGR